MQGKTVLITGGNSGIGKSTAAALAKKGAKVIIACRDQEKGEKAIKEIKSHQEDAKIEMMHCDLASFASIHHLAKNFQQRYSKLDVLINNAGIFCSRYKQTDEGFEIQFGVNHLGHFLLTNLLINPLKKAEKPRVVTVSSSAHYNGTIDFASFKGNPAKYNCLHSYSQSKLANILFTKELARRHPNVDCNCLHPGVVRTPIGNKNATLMMSMLWHLWKPFMCSTKKGAETSVFLASSPEIEGISGQFFDQKQKPKNPSHMARNRALAQKLWDISEKFVA